MTEASGRGARFGAGDIGLCLTTIHPDPHRVAPDEVAPLLGIAARGGFTAFVFQPPWVDRQDPMRTRAVLDDLGVRASVLEGAVRWPTGPAGAMADADALLDMTAAIGAPLLDGTCMTPDLDPAAAADGLAALSERARAYGIGVCIEFVPFLGIPDLATAWRLVRDSGAADAGISLDMMHFQRQAGGPDLALLRSIPGERIAYLQVTDAAPPPHVAAFGPYLTECTTARPLPGDGVIDIAAMLDAIAATEATREIAYQVGNRDLLGEGPARMVARLRANAIERFGG